MFETARPRLDGVALILQGRVLRLSSPVSSARPLIAHVVHRFALGGLERDVLKMINRLPPDAFRHAIICLTDYTDLRYEIERPDVSIVALKKRSGQDWGIYRRFWNALHELKPDIVHTANLPAMEMQVVAALAGVPVRIHGEFGRDTYDLHGTRLRYNLLRKAVRPFVHHYVAVTRELCDWLENTVGVRADRICYIPRGVDVSRFRERCGERPLVGPPGFVSRESFVIGTVGRMMPVKDFPCLVKAFLLVLEQHPELRSRLRLMMIGDGPERAVCERLLTEGGAAELAWLPGARTDVDAVMQGMDLFVLSSIAEGMPNTVLEAMASGLPVVATRAGGAVDLVVEGVTGTTVPVGDPPAMARAITAYTTDPEEGHAHGRRGRERVAAEFTIDRMISGYEDLFTRAVSAVTDPRPAALPKRHSHQG